MKYLSICSGIEAATMAWHPLGWAPAAFSEIEKFPSAVLAHHYPGVPNLGDMTKYKEWNIEPIDLLVGGTPCQSFSVAGLRKGLDDPRGNLMLVFLGIADRFRPQWLVWENVPGVLSSNKGRDFGTFLGALEELGYGWAYRTLDAQYVRVESHVRAVPQRRRRVFVVGCLGDWQHAAEVLFEPDCLRGNPAPSRKAGEEVAPTIRSGSPNGGPGHGARSGDSKDELIVAAHASGVGFWSEGIGTLRAREQDSHENLLCFDTTQVTSKSNYSSPKPGDPCHPLAAGAHPPALCFGGNNQSGPIDVSTALNASGTASGTASGRQDFESETFVAHALRGEGFDASEDGTGLRTPLVPVAFQDDVTIKTYRGFSGTLRRNPGGAGSCVCATWSVRRLTPRECERLQGFPDDYTLIPWRGKPSDQCPDGPRYKALGNSMAVNVMRWIGERVALIEQRSEEGE